MIEEQAKVTRVADDGIWVEVQRKSVCGVCAANKACGTAVLQKVLGNKRTIVRVLSDIPVVAGDDVVVGLEERAFLKGSFAVYLLPLVFMFSFGLLGETLGPQLFLLDQLQNDTAAVVFALFGLLVGAFWLKRFNASIHVDPHYQPIVLRQIAQTDADSLIVNLSKS